MTPCMWWRWRCSSRSRSLSALCSVIATSHGDSEGVSSASSKRYITAVSVHSVLTFDLRNVLNPITLLCYIDSCNQAVAGIHFFKSLKCFHGTLLHIMSVVFSASISAFVANCAHDKTHINIPNNYIAQFKLHKSSLNYNLNNRCITHSNSVYFHDLFLLLFLPKYLQSCLYQSHCVSP